MDVVHSESDSDNHVPFHRRNIPSTSRRPRCNAKICLAYSLCLVSNIMIVSGVCLSFKTKERFWLMLPCVGVALILVGSCFYRSGIVALYRCKPKYKNRESGLFESQMSLNMLPQCFSSLNRSSAMVDGNHSRYSMLQMQVSTDSSSQNQGRSNHGRSSCADR